MRRSIVFTALLAVSPLGRAEVIDKILPPLGLWFQESLVALAFLLAAYFLSRQSLYGWVVPLIAIVLAWPPAIPLEFLPEAQKHFGEYYSVHAQLSALLPVVASLSGVLFGRYRAAPVQK